MEKEFLSLVESLLTSYDPENSQLSGPYGKVYSKVKDLSSENKALLKSILVDQKKLDFKVFMNDVVVDDMCSIFDDTKFELFGSAWKAISDAIVRINLDEIINNSKEITLIFWSGYEDQKDFIKSIYKEKTQNENALKIKISIPPL